MNYTRDPIQSEKKNVRIVPGSRSDNRINGSDWLLIMGGWGITAAYDWVAAETLGEGGRCDAGTEPHASSYRAIHPTAMLDAVGAFLRHAALAPLPLPLRSIFSDNRQSVALSKRIIPWVYVYI